MTLYRALRFLLVAILCVTVIGILSCSGGGGDGPASGTTVKDFKTGESESYDLTTGDADISDILPGAIIAATEGSVGTVEVAPITSGPDLDYAATQIEVSYTGADDLQITVPQSAGDETIVFMYGTLEDAAIDGRDGFEDWWGIPATSTTDTSVTFDLPVVTQGASKGAGLAVTPPKRQFAIANLPAGSTEATRLAAIRTSVRECVDYWLDNLPSTISAAARTEVSGDLAYTISWSNSGNAYQHGDNWISSNAVFYLTKNVQLDIIAHEVGHYMTHVLCGYDRYEEIYQRFPTDFWGAGVEHGIGDYREGRLDMLEDYAYFSTYMITEALQASDLSKTRMWTLFKEHMPENYDYPSHEAYGATMLGTLLRSEKEVYTFNKSKPTADVPVVNATLSDVLGILARGPRDVNELREFISDYLMNKGTEYQYLLPAIMEPLGWTYKGIGSVKFDDDSVVDDAVVYSICQTGEGEYRSTVSTTTGSNGRYLLTRIFPGSNLLRVIYNSGKDSTDVPFTVQWEQETDETLTIPEIIVPKDPLKEVTLSGTWSDAKTLVSKNNEPYITMNGSGTWTVKGTGVAFESDDYNTAYFICKPGAKGVLTITGSASLSGTSYENTFWGDRIVYTLHNPIMLGPIENQNYVYDESMKMTSSGDGSSIIITFEFPANAFWETFQITPQFKVPRDWTIYNEDNEVTETGSDENLVHYDFQSYYFYID